MPDAYQWFSGLISENFKYLQSIFISSIKPQDSTYVH